MSQIFYKSTIGLLLFILPISCLSQQTFDTIKLKKYSECLNHLNKLLLKDGSFKEAVFLTESIFYSDSISKKIFDTNIEFNDTMLLSEFGNALPQDYKARDNRNYLLNYAIAKTLANEIAVKFKNDIYIHHAYTYSFTDPLGKQDWSNMFVTKLLATHEGNCHSLAYLYKILADEVGAKCWLSLAPNHIYIKNYSEKIGWYNTELTSGTFPTDAWVMVTGYVNPEAIKSGLYMDTLSNQQSIALCVLDLAKEYEFQTHNYYDGFILKCCDLVLQYHPVNPMALLLKAETLKKVWLKETEEKFPKPTVTINEMQNAYITLAKLGYREMPEKMYQQWLKDMTTEREKYANKKITETATKK